MGVFAHALSYMAGYDLKASRDQRSAARNMRRARIPENTIMKIAGWKTPNMFRRYDIQDGRDIRQAAEIMENRLAEERTISTISSTFAAQEHKAANVPRTAKD